MVHFKFQRSSNKGSSYCILQKEKYAVTVRYFSITNNQEHFIEGLPVAKANLGGVYKMIHIKTLGKHFCFPTDM